MDPEEAPLRIGILGASRVSPTSIIEPARLTGARLVAVAARDRDRAQDFAERYGVERALGSYEDLVNDPEIEAVYNPLANSLHARWNLAAIAAGKHVLSEKPFAANAAEAREVRDAGKRAGVKVVDGFHYLYHPVTKRLHELVASGELGELQRVETMVMIPPPPPEDPRWSLPLAGGALMDLAATASTLSGPWPPWQAGVQPSSTPGEPNGPACPEWTNGLTPIWSIPPESPQRHDAI
ncbi:uncharacterized oxidoreductase ORF334 [Arthrobacter sp. Hiyo6]|nr:uncharacterized oxidoreductase ORF334 [Arthrobacter sp. Hiyo6]